MLPLLYRKLADTFLRHIMAVCLGMSLRAFATEVPRCTNHKHLLIHRNGVERDDRLQSTEPDLNHKSTRNKVVHQRHLSQRVKGIECILFFRF